MNGKSMVAVVAGAGLLVGAAFAQGEGGRRERRAPGGDGLVEYLGLSAEQKERFQALREEHRKEAEPLRGEGRALHEKLEAALEAKSPDPQVVGQALLAVQQHRDKMKASADEFRKRMKSELTPEQQQKFEAFEAARRVGRGPHGRRGPRPGFPGAVPGGAGFGGPVGAPPDGDDLEDPPSR